jgi:hypothetical protein
VALSLPVGAVDRCCWTYYPEVEVIVPDRAGLTQVRVRHLLPWTYVWSENQEFTSTQ